MAKDQKFRFEISVFLNKQCSNEHDIKSWNQVHIKVSMNETDFFKHQWHQWLRNVGQLYKSSTDQNNYIWKKTPTIFIHIRLKPKCFLWKITESHCLFNIWLTLYLKHDSVDFHFHAWPGLPVLFHSWPVTSLKVVTQLCNHVLTPHFVQNFMFQSQDCVIQIYG